MDLKKAMKNIRLNIDNKIIIAKYKKCSSKKDIIELGEYIEQQAKALREKI